MPTLTLKPGREKSVRNRHPWLFSGAIQRIDRDAQDGDVVDVHSDIGQWLARGYLNRRSQIQVRLLTWNAGQIIDEDFWRSRLQRAIAGRVALAADPFTDAAAGDFSLTEAAQAALRSLGWPATYLGAHANTDPHITIGALQYGPTPAGGGAGVYRRVAQILKG
jgi:hypothetical protein